MRRLRIAHVSATFPPYYGGTGNVCYHNARLLAARGHDVQVVTAQWPGAREDPAGVVVRRLRPLLRVGNAPVMPQLLQRWDVDLVHLHYPFYFGAEMIALSRCRYVVTYHQDVNIVGPLGWGIGLHNRTIGRLLLQRAASVCVTSIDYFRHSSLADYLDPRVDNICELPNGVDLERFNIGPIDLEIRRRWGLPEEGFVALFVGAMDRPHYFKGVPTFLRALARLPEQTALLVGEGGLRPQFEQLAGELGLASRVRFAGRVAADDLARYYRAADVLVLPSETSGEAFGMVLIEAMATGRPVIATDLPGVRSVIGNGRTGRIVPVGDPDALAAALRDMQAQSAAARSEMGRRGRCRVEQQYSWERIGDQLEALYADVLDAERIAHAS